ncbi:signal peptidase I [Fibrobacter succinogenes]|uniref:signal peptidase I n=1 Tax=Fibrobacter succinogenes TaxID=833 RepID=UPI0013D232C4|nr:signal peptidase I [Fibrobacter succinogenes]
MENNKEPFSWKKFVKGLLREIIVPVALALIVIQYVIQAFQIPSGSMEDTLHTGDFLLGLKFTYGSPIPFSNQKFPGYTYPAKGDVVIFRYPGEPEYPDGNPQRYTHLFNALMFGNFYWDHEPKAGQPHLIHYADGPKDYIKRCVAVSGDTVAVHKGRLFVNGKMQDTLPGRGKYTASARTFSPRDERDEFVVPSVGDTFTVESMSLEKLWWLRSLVAQENPDETVELDISLWKDSVEINNYDFEEFKIPVENDRGLALNELFRRNHTVLQQRLTQGDTISGAMSFAYFKELSRMTYLPMIDPNIQGGFTRPVSYMAFEASLLRDLEGNVALLNQAEEDNAGTVELVDVDAPQDGAKTVEGVAGDTLDAPAKAKFEIRRKLLVGGKPIESYVVKTPQFFMMGDNRDNSADSRYWGFVSLRNIRAKAFVIYFSFENDDEAFALKNPFTWWRLPFRIRWGRLGKIIQMID